MESGTARKSDSVACSVDASRKPKMAGVEPEEAADTEASLPAVVDDPVKNRAEDRQAAKRNFIRLS